MTDAFEQEVIEGVAEEIKRLPSILCEIHPAVVLDLIGAAHLTMRHPELTGPHKERLAQAVRDFRSWFANRNSPHVLAIIREGWRDTGFDENGQLTADG